MPSVDLIALSPDGSQVALAVANEQTRQIQIRRTADRGIVFTVPAGAAKIRSLQWAGDHHLLITRSATAEVSGLTGPKREWSLALDLDLVTHKLVPLLQGEVFGVDEKLNTISGAPDIRVIAGRPVAFVVGTTFVDHTGVRTLFRIDLDSRQTHLAAKGSVWTDDWLLDDGGAIIARVDSDERTGRWQLWTRRGDRLTKSMEDAHPLDSPELIGLGRSRDTVMVEIHDGEEWSYHELALGSDQMSAAIPALGGAGLVLDPKTRVVIGASHHDGLRVDYEFLAEPDRRLWKLVTRAFPDATVHIESWSDDRRKLILKVEGKAAGAAYYTLDTVTRHADWLANEYAAIEPDDLGETRAIDYQAADGLTIPAYLTLPRGVAAKGLPLVVLPHGGPGARDDPGFDWWAQALASRGYAVLQPQFRGSTGFGEPFHAAGYGEWGRKMQTDLSDGVARLAADGTIDPKRVCIVGASYGGYAALAGVTLQHGIYRCAVSLAGPADLRAFLAYEETLAAGAQNGTMRFWQRFMGVKSGHDPVLDTLSPLKLAARADVPVLLIHGVDDTVVPFAQSKAMAAALNKAGHPATLVTLPGEDHWLSRGVTRTAMLRATVDFLAVNLPVAVPPAAGTGSPGR